VLAAVYGVYNLLFMVAMAKYVNVFFGFNGAEQFLNSDCVI